MCLLRCLPGVAALCGTCCPNDEHSLTAQELAATAAAACQNATKGYTGSVLMLHSH